MGIQLLNIQPLILTVDYKDTLDLEGVDAGEAYTKYLHNQSGDFEEKPLSEFANVISESINPSARRHAQQMYQYIDLREVDDIYGQILTFRNKRGSEIGSSKHRFQKLDILFAKIMPSLANKKIALVTQDTVNAVASTEFIVLRKRPEAEINLFYLFRALRADIFTRQAVANVTGATGRQRITPRKLLELRIVIPPKELQDQIGDATEKEFTFRTLATEQSKRADDEAKTVLGPQTIRTEQ